MQTNLEEETIRCPQMVFGSKPVQRPTMRESDCRRRIRHQAECIKTCPIAKEMMNQSVPLCKCGEVYVGDNCIICNLLGKLQRAENPIARKFILRQIRKEKTMRGQK